MSDPRQYLYRGLSLLYKKNTKVSGHGNPESRKEKLGVKVADILSLPNSLLAIHERVQILTLRFYKVDIVTWVTWTITSKGVSVPPFLRVLISFPLRVSSPRGPGPPTH